MSTQKDIITKSPKCNFLTKEQYDAIADPDPAQLWAVSAQVVVESYADGTNWYRRYSDGWLEQGGYLPITWSTVSSNTVVTLHAPFLNANYTLQMNFNGGTSTASASPVWLMYLSKAVTSFTTRTDTMAISKGIDWYACGYGA